MFIHLLLLPGNVELLNINVPDKWLDDRIVFIVVISYVFASVGDVVICNVVEKFFIVEVLISFLVEGVFNFVVIVFVAVVVVVEVLVVVVIIVVVVEMVVSFFAVEYFVGLHCDLFLNNYKSKLAITL